MTPDLDDPSLYPAQDPGGMGRLIAAFPRLWQEGWEAAGRFPLPSDYRRVSRIVFLGMGGSAIAGDMAATLLRLEGRGVPALIHRDYGVPPGVDGDTLVVAASYSGETEETLSGIEPALARGAKLLALAHGGPLARAAREVGVPWYPIPVEAPPRAALPYALASLLRLLGDLGLSEDHQEGVREATGVLAALQTDLGPSSPTEKNGAKRLARALAGRISVIYGGGLTAPVAGRWKAQINENAKTWAFAETLPEAHHNSVAGLESPALRDRLFVVLLEEPHAPARMRTRLRLTRELLQDLGISHEVVAAVGSTPLAQMLSATLYGDYVSYYLALLNGVDPIPIGSIERIKRGLAEMSEHDHFT